MGVSYAPPAYYADRLCERGRYDELISHYFKLLTSFLAVISVSSSVPNPARHGRMNQRNSKTSIRMMPELLERSSTEPSEPSRSVMVS